MDMRYADFVALMWLQYKTGWQAGYDVPISPEDFQAQLEGEKERGPAIGNAPWIDADTVDQQIHDAAKQYRRFYTRVVLPQPLPQFALPEYVKWYEATHGAPTAQPNKKRKPKWKRKK
jgi:hypothetical protein